MVDKISQLQAQLSYLFRAVSLVWTPAPTWFVAWSILLVIQGILPAITIYLTRVLVDNLVEAIALASPADSVRAVIWPISLMGGSMILSLLVEESIWWIETAQSEIVDDYIQALVHKKSVEADLGFYESPDYHNRLEQTQNDASEHPLELMENLGGLIKNSITAIAMVTILLPYGFWLPLLLIVSTTPSFFVVLYFNRRYHRWWDDSTIDRRWAEYYNSLLTSELAAPELRLFNLGILFQGVYQDLRLSLRTQELDILRNQLFVRLAAKAVSLLIGGFALAWMLWQAILGFLTLGDLALFYQAFKQGQRLVRSLLNDIGQIYRNSLFLENLFEFLDCKPKIIEPSAPQAMPSSLQRDIQFRQVTFRYPGSDRAVLHNFDLKIPAGKTIAIVGDNGAGKSTLLKLLCRFYDPEAGTIEFDGVDIRHLSLRELRDNITVLFQSPVKYQTTVMENIALANIETIYNHHIIETAAISAGAHEFIMQLPQGYNTLLSKSLAEGTDLSGGEWQRVALARAFLRQSPIVVLDEPTSAMDPWAEAQWLDRFTTMVRDRTAVIITHRFTTAMRADFIYLMKKQQIAEEGTHEELLEKGGLYAQAWAEQTSTNSYSHFKYK